MDHYRALSNWGYAQALWAAMLLTVLYRSCMEAGLAELAVQQALSRLRYLDLLPSDKAFYDAGMADLCT